ncbi:MAG: LAGLIDADG family homing endonuclease [Nanoarchaeota archaeon]
MQQTQISGFSDYIINISGQIYNRFGLEMKNERDRGGYTIKLTKSGENYKRRVNRLLYESFIGEIPSGRCVCYKDNNYYNIALDNLCVINKFCATTRTFTETDQLSAVNAYKSGWHIKEIGRQLLHTKPDNVSRLIKLNNVPVSSKNCYRTSYTLNHNYFETVDTPEKAYLLGLLYADGSVDKNSNQINLISNDIELLEFFRNQVDCNKEFYKNPSHNNAKTFFFSSERMKKDLIKLGCVPRKSLILKFPTENQVPPKLLHHFLRGEFDGDGSIYINNSKNQQVMVYFCGAYDFCVGVDNQLKKLGIKVCKMEKNVNIFRVRVSNFEGQCKLKNFLYKDSTFSLTRKRERFEQYI